MAVVMLQFASKKSHAAGVRVVQYSSDCGLYHYRVHIFQYHTILHPCVAPRYHDFKLY